MAEFSFPDHPDLAPAELSSLFIRGNVDLERDVLETAIGLCEGHDHHTFSENVSGHRLWCRIGIHLDGTKHHEAPWLHYEFRWRPGAPKADDEGMAPLLEFLMEALPKHSVDVQTRFIVPGLNSFGFPLPMPLDGMGVSGFSEMRGARLVQVDPTASDQELYSVILDGGWGAAVATVAVSIESRLEPGVFLAAMSRAVSILDLVLVEAAEPGEQVL